MVNQILNSLIELKDHEFSQIRTLIYRIAGISLSPVKKPLVCSRLGKRLKHYGLNSYTDYVRLIDDPQNHAELQMAVDLLTTNETHFFREPKHFDFLRKQIPLMRRAGKPFHVWSAACSSGEEPYSVAMLLDDVLGAHPWQVFGSDLSTIVLDKAKQGHYPAERVPEVPQNYLSRYCLKGIGAQTGTLLIDKKLRDRVTFMQANLMEPAPKLPEMDVIFLRNVMIYFDQETKRKVVAHLLPLLRSGGYFLVSHSETLNGVNESLRLVQSSVYQKP